MIDPGWNKPYLIVSMQFGKVQYMYWANRLHTYLNNVYYTETLGL